MLDFIKNLSPETKKFAMIFAPSVLIATALIIIIILIVYNKKRKKEVDFNQNDAKNSKKRVKTVYSNKNDDYSQTANLPEPENFSTKEFEFKFAGWDKYFVDENGETKVEAIWIRKPKEYTVSIFGENKDVPIDVKVVNYGVGVDLNGISPTKQADEKYDYVFVGWDKETNFIENDTDVYAVFDAQSKDGEEVESEQQENKTLEEVESEQQEDKTPEDFENQVKQSVEEVETETNDLTEENIEAVKENEVVEEIENNLEESKAEETEKLEQTPENIEESQPKQNEEASFDEPYEEEYEKEETENTFIKTYTDEESLPQLNNIKVGKPAIVHGVTSSKSKNGYKVEKTENVYNSYSINVENKSSSNDNDDIFKRMGVGIRGMKPVEPPVAQAKVEKPKSTTITNPPYKSNGTNNFESKTEDDDSSEIETFLSNSMMVSHKRTNK